MGSAPSKEKKTKKSPTREEELSRRGVLIPPSFGVGTDFVPPPSSSPSSPPSNGGGGGGASSPSSSASVVRSSLPHLILSNRTLGGSGSVPLMALHDDAASRLLGHEHLRPGLWVSASTPDSGGNVSAGGHYFGQPSSSVSGGAGGGGFLSAASVGSNGRGDVSGGFGVTLSTTSGNDGDGVDTNSSSSSAFEGCASAFASRTVGRVGGGVLSAFASVSASDASSSSPAEDEEPASGVVASAASSLSSSLWGKEAPPPSAAATSGAGWGGRVGWNFATRFDLGSSEEREEESSSGGYYRNNPFRKKSSGGGDNKGGTRISPSSVGINLGYAARIARARDAADDDDDDGGRSPLKLGQYDVSDLSSHLILDAPGRGTKAAIEAAVPVSSLSRFDASSIVSSPSSFLGAARGIRPSLSCYASFDLNRVTGLGANEDNGEEERNGGGPPIIVSLHRIDHKDAGGASESAATVSQTVTFDRHVVNPLEDRCPKIRNSVSWAVRMSRTERSDGGSESTSTSAKTAAETGLTAAAAWQVNRGLAFRIRADATGGGGGGANGGGGNGDLWTAGILLRRWAQPRVTASLLFGPAARGGGGTVGVAFKGVGVQIETGPIPGQGRGKSDGGGAPWPLLDGVGVGARVGPDGRVGFDPADLVYGAAAAGGNAAGGGRGDGDGPPKTRAELAE